MFLLSVIFCFTTARQITPPINIYGAWLAYPITKGEPLPNDFPAICQVFLNKDGTFRFHLETHIMVNIVQDFTGSFTYLNGVIRLRGSGKGSFDDGYKKEADKPLQMDKRLVVMGDELRESGFGTDSNTHFEYVRAGKRPKTPMFLIGKTDPKAVALWKNVQMKYAHLRSYEDIGTFYSHGGGYRPKEARFTLKLLRPSFFLCDLHLFEDGKEYKRSAVWKNSLKIHVFNPDFGGAYLSDKDNLQQAIGLLAIDGSPDELFTLLFQTTKDVNNKSYADEQVSFLPEVRIAGNSCLVLQVKDTSGFIERFWIDKKTNLILKSYDNIIEDTIFYHPRINIPISRNAFSLK